MSQEGVDSYECTLDPASQEVALRELNEVPAERMSAVNTFREWILQQPHFTCPTGTEFLLRYLRTAKFSQLRAREVLQGHLTMKTENPHWYDDIDTHDKGLIAVLKSGFALPLGFDKEGRYCVMYRDGVIDTSSKAPYKQNDIWHAMFAFSLDFVHNERTMVNGFNYLLDFTGFEMRHMTYWGMDTMKKSSKIWQGNFPGRFKAFHYYNAGPVAESLMTILMPFMGKKLQERFHLHSNMEEVYKYVPCELMPAEYLPDDYDGPNAGTTQEIIDKMIAHLTSPEVRERILYETRSEWKLDPAKKPTDVPTASFRKLNVD